MNDEVTTITEVRHCQVEIGSMWRISLSNRITFWIGMSEELVPKVGTEMRVIYPNDDEIIVHLPVHGRVIPYTVKKDCFYMDMYELEADYYMAQATSA